jgi:hypothetical protein
VEGERGGGRGRERERGGRERERKRERKREREREGERLSYKVWEVVEKKTRRIAQKLSTQEWPKFTPFEGTNSSSLLVKVGRVCVYAV